MTLAPKERRTQEERRTQTIEKLVVATAEALAEIGYARTTVNEISSRSGVSQGGIFRHFATLDELMAKTGEHVGKEMVASYRKKFLRVKGRDRKALEHAIRLLREHCLSKDNHAWYELFNAARTNKPLKRALTPVIARYMEEIAVLATDVMPDLAALGPKFFVMIDTLISTFDGEALHRGIFETPIPAEDRIAFLASFAEHLLRED